MKKIWLFTTRHAVVIGVCIAILSIVTQILISHSDRKTLITMETIKILESTNNKFHKNYEIAKVRDKILQKPCNYKVLEINDTELNYFQNYINLIDKTIFYLHIGLSNEDLIEYYVSEDIKAIKKCPPALEQLKKIREKNLEHYKDLYKELTKE